MSGPDLRRAAAARAVELVHDGMRLGIGTGTTANAFIALLGERVQAGLEIVGVPTSEATRNLAEQHGIPLTTLEQCPALDLTIDGADEVDDALRLIKGGGGALLREKIVAHASRRMVVIADAAKRVVTLGAFPLPIEVNLFGLGATRRGIETAIGQAGCAGELVLRKGPDGGPYVTDGGHAILDAHLDRIPDAEMLSGRLWAVPGVVEHGLFLGLAQAAILAQADGEAAIVTVIGDLSDPP